MVTTHDVHSAYPVPVADLLPRARSLAAELGEVPSRNRLMAELRIGAPKARAVREALQDQAGTDDGRDAASARLHVVPDADEPTETETGIPDEPGPEPGEPGTEPRNGSGPESRPDPGPAPLPTREAQAQPASDGEPDAGPVPDTRDERVPGQATRAAEEPVTPDANPDLTTPASMRTPRAQARSRVRSWPVLLLAAPAFVAIWSGWVGLGSLTGFGTVHPLPGIWDSLQLNTAITLPIGMETYAAYALRVWVAGRVPARARRFAKFSAIGALALGALGQVAYHLMAAAGVDRAPWPITTAVSCLPVAVLGMGAALAHLLHTDHDDDTDDAHEEVAR